MKKNLKKIMSLLLACIMCLGMAITASAEAAYSITINNAEAGYKYTAYQILSGKLDGTGTILTDIGLGNGIDSSETSLSSILTELRGNAAFASAASLNDIIEVLSGKAYQRNSN